MDLADVMVKCSSSKTEAQLVGSCAPCPPLLTVLGPELDRLLAGDLLAELDQRCLAGDQLAGG